MLNKSPPYHSQDPIKQHVFIAGHPGVNDKVQQLITEHALKVLKQEGPQAFAMPKSAAVAHEVGHAIVGAHEGINIVSLRVFKRQDAWCGMTYESRGWKIDATTPTEKCLNRARFLIAGEVGERVLDPDGYRSGTSIDEVVFSQSTCAFVHHERAAEFSGMKHPSELFNRIYAETFAIIETNEDLARQLILKLDHCGELHGKPLWTALQRVKQLERISHG